LNIADHADRLTRISHYPCGMVAKGIVVPEGIPRSQWGALSAAADTGCVGKARKAPMGPWGAARNEPAPARV
jgi:hypothetical protein